ncbi:MAG TPA: phenylalanine--tRNA ligase subunit beta [Syntrophales bacterium]|nr:phenylalanine--tRNA ligase subunit beta [Syntrophales bacterium]
MKVSLKWLKDYVDFDLPAQELADRLTMAGLEVDALEEKRADFSGVVVARIVSAKRHPDADKLSLCEASIGDRTLPIVCGAPNVREGILVPLATVGAVIPGGYTIKLTKIRGQVSEGMFCSEEELGIGSDNTGIMVLPDELIPGMPLDQALDLTDTVLDVGVTPNRSDCLSIVGIAREVAAITGKSLRCPAIAVPESEEKVSDVTSVTILDPDLCPEYTARIVRNVAIRPSPLWMRQRLEAVGLRAINNVVDITNFVMLELGQPLHAFDFRFLEEGRIVVRKSREGEIFISLDEKERVLKEGTLLICDGVKPVAIAGIMGGLNSEVKDDTSTVLLESAYFNPGSIRRSSRFLGMGTDAAFRFERGIDPQGVVRALDRAAGLMAELADGVSCLGYIDAHPQEVQIAKDIPLRVTRVNDILGISLTEKEIVPILESLEMTVMPEDGNPGIYRITPPTCRVDLTREIDLIEEVARLHGYDRIPVTLPAVTAAPFAPDPRRLVEDRVRALLNGYGYSEVITYSFVSPNSTDLLALRPDDFRRRMLKIMNPLTEDQSVMRTALVPSLLKTMLDNANAGTVDLKIFEIGKVFHPREGLELPEERDRIGALLTGRRYEDRWHFTSVQSDFYDLKGCLEGVLEGLGIREGDFRVRSLEPFLHPGRSCDLFHGDLRLGFLGEVHPDVLSRLDLKNRAMVFELDVEALSTIASRELKFRGVPRYPSSSRDVAFLVNAGITSGDMIRWAAGNEEELLEKIYVFDVYAGQGIPEGMKSLGLRFSYRAPDRTLTDQEIHEVHSRIMERIMAASGARIR